MSVRHCIVLFLLTLLPILSNCGLIEGAYQLEYIIKVHSDGSSTWIIEEKGIGIQASIETFSKKVKTLVELAQEVTQRNMSVGSFAMNVSVSGSYKIIRYRFHWNNFSKVENFRIIIGDVFNVEDFFAYLYGDGIVCVEYPKEYIVENVSPPPHERDDSIQMLRWYGIEDFSKGEPKIVLKERSAPSEFLNIDVIILICSIAIIIGAFFSFYHFKSGKKKKINKFVSKTEKTEISLEIEDDEEKIVNLLKASGGHMYQSAIADLCGFSRAKTSKLLKTMEEKGKIKRLVKGREKVVTLLEEDKNN